MYTHSDIQQSELRKGAREALDKTLSGEDPTAAFQFVNNVGPNEAAYVLTLPKKVQRDLYEARRLDNVARREGGIR
jgi:hypothetical protein